MHELNVTFGGCDINFSFFQSATLFSRKKHKAVMFIFISTSKKESHVTSYIEAKI